MLRFKIALLLLSGLIGALTASAKPACTGSHEVEGTLGATSPTEAAWIAVNPGTQQEKKIYLKNLDALARRCVMRGCEARLSLEITAEGDRLKASHVKFLRELKARPEAFTACSFPAP